MTIENKIEKEAKRIILEAFADHHKEGSGTAHHVSTKASKALTKLIKERVVVDEGKALKTIINSDLVQINISNKPIIYECNSLIIALAKALVKENPLTIRGE